MRRGHQCSANILYNGQDDCRKEELSALLIMQELMVELTCSNDETLPTRWGSYLQHAPSSAKLPHKFAKHANVDMMGTVC